MAQRGDTVRKGTVYRTLNRRLSPWRTILPPTGIDPMQADLLEEHLKGLHRGFFNRPSEVARTCVGTVHLVADGIQDPRIEALPAGPGGSDDHSESPLKATQGCQERVGFD